MFSCNLSSILKDRQLAIFVHFLIYVVPLLYWQIVRVSSSNILFEDFSAIKSQMMAENEKGIFKLMIKQGKDIRK